MRADRLTVFDLFDKQRRYLVPLYQRGYVWSKVAQWEPLWRDIADLADRPGHGLFAAFLLRRAESGTGSRGSQRGFLAALEKLHGEEAQPRATLCRELALLETGAK